MSDHLIQQLNEKAVAYREATDDLMQLRIDHPKVFADFEEISAERDALLEQMKAMAKAQLQLPAGAKALPLECGFVATRILATRSMTDAIMTEMSAELIAAGVLKTPSFSAVEKAVGAGALDVKALAFAAPVKQAADLVVGEDYTVTIKAPKD